MDEARHVEVFAKYLDTKLTGHYPINAHLQMLLDDIIDDSRWDMTYLGMQIMVEGLALAAFGFMHMLTEEPAPQAAAPLRDERRGPPRRLRRAVASRSSTRASPTPRCSSARSSPSRPPSACATASSSRRCGSAWASTSKRMVQLTLEHQGDKNEDPFQQLLFSKIVPNCKKLGLLDRNDHWLRKKFDEINVIQFEDWVDTGEEYESMALGETLARRGRSRLTGDPRNWRQPDRPPDQGGWLPPVRVRGRVQVVCCAAAGHDGLAAGLDLGR